MDPIQAAALFTALFEHRDHHAPGATSARRSGSHPRRRSVVARLRTRRHPAE
jgi:hypothetical protein